MALGLTVPTLVALGSAFPTPSFAEVFSRLSAEVGDLGQRFFRFPGAFLLLPLRVATLWPLVAWR